MFSSGKTFVAADLAVSVMTGYPFAGREVLRRGAVLWLAAEGANEVDARIGAAAEARSGGNPVEALPFARQAFDVPKLTAPEAKEQILELAAAFKAGLAQRFPNVELVMVAIDTLGSAAGFADGNSSSEAQAVMNMLRAVNVATGALVLLIDHFGKAVETGVMGASAKAQSAEAILAVLSDKDGDGNHSNRRMTVAKLRGGPSGAVTPFKLRQVPVGGQNATTCVVDWSAAETALVTKPEKERPAWTLKSRLFKSCLGRVLGDHGQVKHPFGADAPQVKAVLLEKVRAEFIASYAADTHEAKKKQWVRMLKETTERELVATRSLGTEPPQDWIWFTTKGEASNG